MTVAEVADILRCAKMTVYRLVNDGTLSGQRITKRLIRVSTASLRDYLAQTGI